MSAKVSVNGRLFDEQDAVISVFDHGFLFGEGVYETIRTYNGQPFLFDRHMRRLRRSAGMLVLPVPLTDVEIDRRIRDTMGAADLGRDGREAYIRLLVTRGIGDLTYDPAATPHASTVLIVKPHVPPPPEAFELGVEATLATTVRNHPATVNPLIKSNNLLNSALAMQEAVARRAFEAIMRNYRGELAECSTANLFVVSGGAALTPPLESGLLPGITREFLFEIGGACGVDVREQVLGDADLFGSDEAFLTSTTREIVPIVRVDGRAIGNGRPGPVTQALLGEFRRMALELTRAPQPAA